MGWLPQAEGRKAVACSRPLDPKSTQSFMASVQNSPHFDGTTLPPEDERIFSGRLDKKVLASSGVQWQSRLAVLTKDILAFTSMNGDSRDYWPEVR